MIDNELDFQGNPLPMRLTHSGRIIPIDSKLLHEIWAYSQLMDGTFPDATFFDMLAYCSVEAGMCPKCYQPLTICEHELYNTSPEVPRRYYSCRWCAPSYHCWLGWRPPGGFPQPFLSKLHQSPKALFFEDVVQIGIPLSALTGECVQPNALIARVPLVEGPFNPWADGSD